MDNPLVTYRNCYFHVNNKVFYLKGLSDDLIGKMIQVYKSSIIIKFKSDSQTIPIKVDNLKEFQNFVTQIFSKSVLNFITSSNIAHEFLILFDQYILRDWAGFILTENFRQKVLQFQQLVFNEHGINFTLSELDELDYQQEIDFFRFYNSGGSMKFLLDEVFQFKTIMKSIGKPTPGEFLTELIDYFKTNLSLFSLQPFHVTPAIYTFPKKSGHAFIIQPYRFRDILYYPRPFKDYVKEFMDDPSQQLLNAELSIEKRQKIVRRFFSDQYEFEKVDFMVSFCATAKQFKEAFLTYLAQGEQVTFNRIFNRILFEVPLSKIENNPSEFLAFAKRRGMVISSQVLSTFISNIRDNYEGREFTPNAYAYFLQKATRFYNEPLHYHLDIEKIFIEYYNLPRMIDLADLNWTEENTTENPIHERLIAKIDLITGQIAFFSRKRYQEVPFHSEDNENFYEQFYVISSVSNSNLFN